MNTFSTILALLGLIGIPISFIYIILCIIIKKWRSNVTNSLLMFAISFGFFVLSFLSHNVSKPQNDNTNATTEDLNEFYQSSETNISTTNTLEFENTSEILTSGDDSNENNIIEDNGILLTENILRSNIEKVIEPDRIEDFVYIPENNYTLITFKASDIAFSSNMIIEGAYMDIKSILETIQPIIDTDTRICVTANFLNDYGDSQSRMVIKSDYTLDTIQKINFDNCYFENIPNIADSWWDDEYFRITTN